MTGIAAIYLRRSSADEDNPGLNTEEDQRNSSLALARAYVPDATVEEYRDWNYSGARDDRPGLQRLEQDIRDGRVVAVFAAELTRLGRGGPAQTLPFFELCKTHGVKVVTKREGPLGVDSPFGEFVLTIMSAFARMEHQIGKARSAGAREARKARHAAVGLTVPSSIPPYGWVNVTEGGITRTLRDPSVNFGPIVAAYTEAGSVRQTAVLLNARGVLAPRGGLWSLTPLRRVLERLADEGLITLPERNKRQRHPVGTPALLAGLVVCHCGHRMTPNTVRGQLYCASARSNADHGRSSVTEKALLAVLRPEADLYVRTIRMESRAAGDELAKQRAVIERRQAALDARLDVDRITPDAYREATRALIQELGDLQRDAAVTKSLRIDKVPSWDDVAAMNAWLRRLWVKVQLDNDMVPTARWRDERWRLDEDRLAGQEAEHLDPEAAGLVMIDSRRKAAR